MTVPRTRPGVWWVRLRYRQRTAERHLDALADTVRTRGWAQLKMYAESPPVLWVYPQGAESAAVSVAAVRAGGRWVLQISRLIEYPCEAVDRVAGVLDDVLRDRVGRPKVPDVR
ncbi:hypothetical protein [Actinomadura monticuli]|uniref:Uncharacterized protein n=1 Tax=Actinomadura monticuli TaxID=3097367 RepID=A0ABV4QBE8_9ACTN